MADRSSLSQSLYRLQDVWHFKFNLVLSVVIMDFLCFVDRVSTNNLVNKPTWCTLSVWHVYHTVIHTEKQVPGVA
jgi:tellurite resistance protein TehA-like permease